MAELLLDSDIRLWVFLPIVVITFLVGIIRHYVTILLSTEKKVELQQISDRYFVEVRCSVRVKPVATLSQMAMAACRAAWHALRLFDDDVKQVVTSDITRVFCAQELKQGSVLICAPSFSQKSSLIGLMPTV